MKNFIKWRILVTTCLVCLAPIILGVLLWDKLPHEIAIHFDINNNPDNFASKGFAVFGLPLFMVLLQIVCCVINDVNAKEFGDRKKLELVTKWIIPILTVILQGITFAYALETNVDIRRSVIILVGLIFIVIGNYLPKLEHVKNFDVDTQKARKINRFIGYENVIMGILAILTIFLPPVTSIIWLFMLIPYATIAIVYGIYVSKK